MKYLTFLPVAILVLLFACSDLRESFGASSASAAEADAQTFEGSVCDTLRKELAAARTLFAADPANHRAEARARSLAAVAGDVCGWSG